MTAMEQAIEAGAAILISRVNAPEQEIYRAMREALRAALPIVEGEISASLESGANFLRASGAAADGVRGYIAACEVVRSRLAKIME